MSCNYDRSDALEVDANVKFSTCANIAERISGLFIPHIKAKNAEQEIWSLEDLVVARICFLEDVRDHNKGKVNFSEP